MRSHYRFAAMFILMLFSVAAAAQDTPLERDDVLQVDVIRAIGNNVNYTIYDAVEVTVTDGVIRLDGYVTAPYKSKTFEKVINKRFSGAFRGLENNITVLPPSASDNRIRYILARRIYNDSRLLRYSLTRWPYPIHIVVRNGHVKLEGSVKYRMDSQIIESKIRDVLGVVSLENNLNIG